VPHCDPADLPKLALLARNRTELMEQTGLARDEASKLRALTVQNIDEFSEAQRGHLQELFITLTEKLKGETDKLSAMQTAITLGIVCDKLNQAPKVLNQALHLHIKGDASGALKAILGPAAQSVFRPEPPQDSKAPNYLDVSARPADPSADATDTMQGDSKSLARKK
jgi:hypothetical protein